MNAWICIVEYGLFNYVREHGIYGSVKASDENRNWSSMAHAICVRPGDLMFFYRRADENGRMLHGVFEAVDKKFYDPKRIWSGQAFPYRVFVKPSGQYGSLPKGLDHLEFLSMIDEGMLWTMRSPAMERRGTKKSVHKITLEEASCLIDRLREVNSGERPEYNIPNPYRPGSPDYGYFNNKLKNTLRRFPLREVPVENVLEAWLMDAFLRRTEQAVKVFGDYREFLCEIPIFVCEPSNQIDVLLTFNGDRYLILELKKGELRKKRSGRMREHIRRELVKIEKYRMSLVKRRAHGDVDRVECAILGKGVDMPLGENLPRYLKLIEYEISEKGELVLRDVGR